MKRFNPRRIKIHRSYSVEEVASHLGVHKNTVRAWIKSGLQTVDDRRPTLILGRQLSTFLFNRRKQRKRPCQPGQMYCVRCRAPKTPAGRIAEYIALTAESSNLRGTCPDCGCFIYRRVSRSNLATGLWKIVVSTPQAEQRIGDNATPSQKHDSNKDPETDEDA